VEKAKLSQIQSLAMVAQDLASEAQENWIYIMGEYINGRTGEVVSLTEELIESYVQVTTEKINGLFRKMFWENQRRLNIKLRS